MSFEDKFPVSKISSIAHARSEAPFILALSGLSRFAMSYGKSAAEWETIFRCTVNSLTKVQGTERKV